jgi:hypothetical protein
MTRRLRSWRFWLAPVVAVALAAGPGCGPATTGASKDNSPRKDAEPEKKDKQKDGGKEEKKKVPEGDIG